jgi:hypothetical protein
MRRLFSGWAAVHRDASEVQVVEPPLEFLTTTCPQRAVAMVHSTLGSRRFPSDADFGVLAEEGWIPDFNDRDNFLEMVHSQAHYFQRRFFPRFRWFTLHAPAGEFFVIADRAVGWAADGYVDAPPSCLRDPSAYVLAPLSSTIVLVGRHTTDPWRVTPAQVNAVISVWAHDWIAGPTRRTVEAALAARRAALEADPS